MPLARRVQAMEGRRKKHGTGRPCLPLPRQKPVAMLCPVVTGWCDHGETFHVVLT